MRKFVYLFVCLLICGCKYILPFDIPRYFDVMFINSLNEKLYLSYTSKTIKESDRPSFISYLNPTTIVVDFGDSRFSLGEHIDFYQDKYKKCYLFSISAENLPKSINLVPQGIVLINKNGMKIISKTEYNRIKPTFKPHQYDPSLCKPKPDNVK